MTDRTSLSALTLPSSEEFILGGATIITGAFLPVIEDGAVFIQAGKIIAVGPTKEVRARYLNVPFIDATDYVLLPGLFNSHTHVAMGFFRGLGHGKEEMIESFLFPAEKSLTPELLESLAYSYIYDGLRAGVTSFVDHYYFSEGIGRAFEKFGVRGWLGETVADLGGAFPGKESWTRAKNLIEKSSFGPLISHLVAPHASDTVSSELLQECATYAKEHNLTLHMHLSQTPGEYSRVHAREKMTPVAAAQKAGALGPRSLIVHLTSATKADLQLVKDSGATIGYCPTSTLIYDKLAPIADFYGMDIPLAIGTDCAASNDSADSLGELKVAAVLARDHGIDIGKITPDHLLAMATTIPAKVLGREHDLGTIEAGKLADMVMMKTSLSSEPRDNPLANVIYSMGARDVSHVMIQGKWTLWNRELPYLDESDLKSEYQKAVGEIGRRIRKVKDAATGHS